MPALSYSYPLQPFVGTLYTIFRKTAAFYQANHHERYQCSSFPLVNFPIEWRELLLTLFQNNLEDITFPQGRCQPPTMGITPQNMTQTSNSLLSPTKSMVARGNQW